MLWFSLKSTSFRKDNDGQFTITRFILVKKGINLKKNTIIAVGEWALIGKAYKNFT